MSPDDAIAVWSSGRFEFLDDHDPHKTECTMDGKSQIVQLVEEGLILRGQCQATFVHQPPPRHHHATTTQPLCHHAQQINLDACVYFPSPPPTPMVPKNICIPWYTNRNRSNKPCSVAVVLRYVEMRTDLLSELLGKPVHKNCDKFCQIGLTPPPPAI